MIRSRRGVSALEFALTAPVLLLAAAAILDLVWFLDQQAVVTDVVADAARASVRGTSDGPAAAEAAERNGRAWLDAMGLPCGDDCLVEASAVEVAGWAAVRLDVAVPVRPLTGFLSPTWTARASTTLVLDDAARPAKAGVLPEPPPG